MTEKRYPLCDNVTVVIVAGITDEQNQVCDVTISVNACGFESEVCKLGVHYKDSVESMIENGIACGGRKRPYGMIRNCAITFGDIVHDPDTIIYIGDKFETNANKHTITIEVDGGVPDANGNDVRSYKTEFTVTNF